MDIRPRFCRATQQANMDSLLTWDTTSFLVFAATFFGGVLIFKWGNDKTAEGLPPGPTKWPIIGSMPSLAGDIRVALTELKKKHGDVFTIHMGPKCSIVLASYDATKEAFVKQGAAFSGRLQDDFIVKEIAQGKGIIMTEGKLWQDQRRIIHNILRKLGLGQNIMEIKIKEELLAFEKILTKNLDKPFNAGWLIHKAVANIIYSVVFGERKDYFDPKFNLYIEKMDNNFKAVVSAGPATAFPILRYLPGDPFKIQRVLRTAQELTKEFTELVREHNNKPAANQEDFIDMYQTVMNENPELGIDEGQVVSVVGDLFFAGTETTSTTIKWAILYMIHNPETMKRMQKEIDQVIEKDRLPTMADRTKLPYVEAFINEVHRLSNVTPLGVPHSTIKDTHFRGYFIPKGVMVISAFSTIHLDPTIWEDPEKFNPERFLNDSGTEVVNTEKLIPFSIGKRVCLGEALAQMELFLFMTYLLQKFTFEPVKGRPLPTLEGVVTVSHTPKDYEIVVRAR